MCGSIIQKNSQNLLQTIVNNIVQIYTECLTKLHNILKIKRIRSNGMKIRPTEKTLIKSQSIGYNIVLAALEFKKGQCTHIHWLTSIPETKKQKFINVGGYTEI